MRRRGRSDETAPATGRDRGNGTIAELDACGCCAVDNASESLGVAASLGNNCGTSWPAIICVLAGETKTSVGTISVSGGIDKGTISASEDCAFAVGDGDDCGSELESSA